jgi:Mlc titration factor MtfA (ptsG expression regulator)
LFGLIRRLRRRSLLERPFPPGWEEILESHLPFYSRLNDHDRTVFRDHVKLFVWERAFIGAGGLEISDTHRVVIAGAAARLIQRLDIGVYDRLREIVVYPHDYRHPDGSAVVLGEAHNWGVVVLSFPAVLRGLANPCDGWDTALHEFAHVLDRAGGGFNGTPSLRADAHYLPWAQVMQQHFEALRGGAPAESRVLRAYGAKNPAEFFAVATEAFFERPSRMRALTPALFEELRTFYGLEPTEAPECVEPTGKA